MAEKLSLGIRNRELWAIREAFQDCVMDIYTGTPPDDADDAYTGTRLARISVAGAAVTSATISTRNEWKLVFEDDHDEGDDCTVHIHYNGDTGTDYTFTVGAAHSNLDLRKGVADMLNKIPYLMAVESEDATPTILYVGCRVAGDVVIITDAVADITFTPTESEEEARSNALWFASPSGGTMSKSSDVWSDTVEATGVAGYFRIIRMDDLSQVEDTTGAYLRLQGSVSTSGAELNLSNTSLTAGATLTIDSYTIGQPAE